MLSSVINHSVIVRKLLAASCVISFESACKIVMHIDIVRKNIAVQHEHVEAETLSIHQNFKNQSTKIQSHKQEDTSEKVIEVDILKFVQFYIDLV